MEIPTNLFRYMPPEDYILDNLRNNYLWFSKWEDYNDPFDGRISIRPSYSYNEIFPFLLNINAEMGFRRSMEEISEVSWSYAYGKTNIKEVFAKEYSIMSDKVRTCCFTTIHDNILMWSHYAKSHKGVCLEFDPTQDPETFTHLIPMKYVEDYPEHNYLGDTIKQIESLVRHKNIRWQYENEYRIFKYPETRNLIHYSPLALKSVIFGCKSSPDFIWEVKEALTDKPGVKFKRCELGTNKYELIIKDI